MRRILLATVVAMVLVCVGASAASSDTAPPAPTGVSASQGLYAGKVVVTYDLVAGATSYEIRRSQTAMKPRNPNATDDDGHYEDMTALPGERYLYWVDACNASGCSDTIVSAQGSAADEPQPPTNLVASDGTFAAWVRVIYWPWQLEHVTYNIYRQTNGTFDPNKPPVATGVEDTTWYDHAVTLGQVYYYWATTVNVVGESAPSNADSGFAGGAVSPTPGPSVTPWSTRTPPAALFLPMIW